MALMSVQFYSQSLCGSTEFKVILPNDVNEMTRKDNPHYARPTKTLVLLHGYSGTNTEWLLNTRILEISTECNLAILCPLGGNSFYLDGPETGRKYCTYVGKELIDYASATFGLSKKREDIFIGGFSMGGFGAIHTALAFPEQFGKALCFSAALIQHNVEAMKPDMPDDLANYAYYRFIFGEPEKMASSVNNPEYLLKQLKAQGRPIPGIFQCIGTEDFLYRENQLFRSFLTEQGVPFTYRETSGEHNHITVRHFLDEAIDFLLEG